MTAPCSQSNSHGAEPRGAESCRTARQTGVRTRRRSRRAPGALNQVATALAAILVIPVMTLFVVFQNEGNGCADAGSVQSRVLIGLIALIVVLGFAVLSRYPRTILRLRGYLEEIVRGEMPDQIRLLRGESDIEAIERSLNLIVADLRARLDTAERERARLENEARQGELLRSMGMLAAGLTHEINTPIQFVRDNLEFLAKAAADLPDGFDRAGAPESERMAFVRRELDRAVRETREGLEQVGNLVRAMKDFARFQDGDQLVPCDLNEAIRATALISSGFWKHAARLDLDLDPGLPPTPCRLTDIKQAVLNLIVNAAQAIRSASGGGDARGKSIRVSTRRVDGFAEIRVSDNGPGMSPAVEGRLFEAFFTTKPPGVGTGLGLWLAHSSVVNGHGGMLRYEATEGGGATFILRLPLNAVGTKGAAVRARGADGAGAT